MEGIYRNLLDILISFFCEKGDALERKGFGESPGGGSLGRLILNGTYSWFSMERNSFAFGYTRAENIRYTPSLVSLGMSWKIKDIPHQVYTAELIRRREPSIPEKSGRRPRLPIMKAILMEH
jgi:hypothetical protein